jgi:hypothetical protein
MELIILECFQPFAHFWAKAVESGGRTVESGRKGGKIRYQARAKPEESREIAVKIGGKTIMIVLCFLQVIIVIELAAIFGELEKKGGENGDEEND